MSEIGKEGGRSCAVKLLNQFKLVEQSKSLMKKKESDYY
jgi:hypothetical protein